MFQIILQIIETRKYILFHVFLKCVCEQNQSCIFVHPGSGFGFDCGSTNELTYNSGCSNNAPISMLYIARFVLLDNNFSYYDKLYKIEIDRLSSLSGVQLLHVHMEKNLNQRLKILNRYAPEKHVERPTLLSDHGLLMAYLIKARVTTTDKIFHNAYAMQLQDRHSCATFSRPTS